MTSIENLPRGTPYGGASSLQSRVHSVRWLILLFLGICLSAQAGLATDSAVQEELAPLSSEFMGWHLDQSMLMVERGERSGQTFGRLR